ncbi:membrane protein insertase YidC [Roseomonas hellenica]|uniref:Membrane protein insertase YidC n=1 Tax=Plastoroseomonas hellenica TaxID=2687306 RepID=A0ABS5F0X6_9PROT|nr:membrane protein insertase YidC [Plastoroseomonas hellenica]MBR0666209.1 membrane protein insertase YidC [Plastoroseomonas hellenica]
MDQKRLLAAIALSIGILLLFDVYNRGNRPPAPPPQTTQQAAQAPTPGPTAPDPSGQAVTTAPGDAPAAAPRGPAPRLPVAGPRVEGSINLRGAQLDQLVLRDYRETIEPNSPLVQLFAPRETAEGYYAQWGWTAADGRTRVPDGNTEWQANAPRLSPDSPVTLTWDNGQGQVFEIGLTLDANYMVGVEQRVRNSGAEQVSVLPWARIRRERTPHLAGYYVLHEGFIGVLDGRLQEMTYANVKSEGEKRRGAGFEQDARGGSWAGFTDKYWLAALIPAERDTVMRTSFRHVAEGGQDRWQADMAPNAPQIVAAGATAQLATRLFAGAKVVSILDDYATRLGITDFDKAVDFGWFYFLTKPFFYAIHWINGLVHNFGVAILIFTLAIKLLFFPLQNKAYHSMAKMKILGPKMQEIRERHKEDPQKAQTEMMALYRSEKVNPASGCLPIVIQIPVFFSLYKVIFVTIEMRHAPFVAWIRDLSAPDPTNLFNLFGLLPFDPMQYSHFLHMPALALLMGATMWAQQRLNPQPPDPIQAKIFAWMPVIFTFMLASFPAGLVVYWTWNNLLSIAQQSYIMRHDRAKLKAERRNGALAKKG